MKLFPFTPAVETSHHLFIFFLFSSLSNSSSFLLRVRIVNLSSFSIIRDFNSASSFAKAACYKIQTKMNQKFPNRIVMQCTVTKQSRQSIVKLAYVM